MCHELLKRIILMEFIFLAYGIDHRRSQTQNCGRHSYFLCLNTITDDFEVKHSLSGGKIELT